MARRAGNNESRRQVIRELNELIAALDRRVPHVERSGEMSIARAAGALRDEAVKRIADLEREMAEGTTVVDAG